MRQEVKHMREQETAFVGKITASVSHEFMNVLAIIKERSGLIEDLLALDDSSFPYREKLAKTLKSIREQVNRGMEISDKLNRFAHSMDESTVRLALDDFLKQFAFLMQRLIRLKKIQLAVMPADPSLFLHTDPFRLQMILSASLEFCLDRIAEKGSITLESWKIENEVVIRCIGEPVVKPQKGADRFSDLQNNLQNALESLGARLLSSKTKDQIGFEIVFT